MSSVVPQKSYPTEIQKVLKIILYLNVFVLILKIIAGFTTQSLSILGDAAHSTSDMLNNIVGIIVIKHASNPPDKNHPYGYGKIETLAAFGIVTFLAVAFIEIMQSAVGRLLHPVELPLFRPEVVFMLIATLIINLFVWIYERKKAKELNSNFLLADSSHTGSDVLMTVTVLCSQFFIARGMHSIDAIVAIIIAIFIAKAAHEIVMDTVPVLLDRAWLDDLQIENSVLKVPGVTKCYDIYSRKSPNSAFIELKINVIPKDLLGAHEVADNVEDALIKEFGDCKIMIHIEP